MIAKETYTIDYVNTLREKYKKDPSLLERVLFAFGLLEAIARVGMPFVFKGVRGKMILPSFGKEFFPPTVNRFFCPR